MHASPMIARRLPGEGRGLHDSHTSALPFKARCWEFDNFILCKQASDAGDGRKGPSFSRIQHPSSIRYLMRTAWACREASVVGVLMVLKWDWRGG